MGKVTMQQIADQLGVSKVAVYKALNDKPGVSAALKARVKSEASDLGYVPVNTRYKTHLNFLFVIRKEFFLFAGEQFYTSIYYYLSAECEKIDSRLTILFYDETPFCDTLSRALKSAKDPVSGIFIAGGIDEISMKGLSDFKIPFVFIDFYSSLFNYDYVCIDNYNVSYFTTNYLIENGHREIGFVGDISTTAAIRDRYFGYRKALLEQGIPANPVYHINANIEKDSEPEMTLPERLPTAFVCHCDSAAQKLYLLLKFHGYSIPGDVSVVSFDNTELCKSLRPALTSVGVNKERYAKKSLEMMMDSINKVNKNHFCLLKPTLSERDSVKKLC